MPTERYRSLIKQRRGEAADLELPATSAYLIGRDDDYLQALERAYRAYLDSGERLLALRCAVWLSTQFFRGEAGRATGWLRHAQRMLELGGRDCAERGHLMRAAVDQYLEAGDHAANVSPSNAAVIGDRCGDAELVAMAPASARPCAHYLGTPSQLSDPEKRFNSERR